jgi:hypothetical protein
MQSVEREEEMEVTIDHTRVRPGSDASSDPQTRRSGIQVISRTPLVQVFYTFRTYLPDRMNSIIESCHPETDKRYGKMHVPVGCRESDQQSKASGSDGQPAMTTTTAPRGVASSAMAEGRDVRPGTARGRRTTRLVRAPTLRA